MRIKNLRDIDLKSLSLVKVRKYRSSFLSPVYLIITVHLTEIKFVVLPIYREISNKHYTCILYTEFTKQISNLQIMFSHTD